MLGRDRGRLSYFPHTPQRVPSRLGCLRRHLVSDRPRRDCSVALLRPKGLPRIRSTRATATSRCEFMAAARSIAGSPLALRRGARAVCAATASASQAVPTPSPPQLDQCRNKRNPDSAELGAAPGGRRFGVPVASSSFMKEFRDLLKDMQETEPCFEAADTLELCPRRDDRHGARPRRPAVIDAAAAARGLLHGYRPADWLGEDLTCLPQAASATGSLVKLARTGEGLAELTLAESERSSQRSRFDIGSARRRRVRWRAAPASAARAANVKPPRTPRGSAFFERRTGPLCPLSRSRRASGSLAGCAKEARLSRRPGNPTPPPRSLPE